jgi:tRNA guanosine-2'-O-methyltransferase
MDFASVPFQTLLVQNAGDEQLLSFLQQLDEQYANAVDEKVRFGTLQILLPIFKAHLIRLDDYKKEEACLEQFAKPWMISSFSQDSMVATESVGILENTVSFLMARSLLLNDSQEDTTFGKSTLSVLLGQLISAMEAEPDFVDLKPMELIETNIEDCRTQWDQVQTLLTVQDTATTPLLDLECCLEVLNRFVRDLNENDELLSLENVSDSARKEIRQWMGLIFTIAVAMIPCTDSTIRRKISHDLLPNLLRWQQNPVQEVELDKQVQWCEVKVFSEKCNCMNCALILTVIYLDALEAYTSNVWTSSHQLIKIRNLRTYCSFL